MDEERFDAVAKAAAGGMPRRRLLAALVGSVAAVGWRGESRAEGRYGWTYEACQKVGGEVRARYSACHDDGNCGALRYRWENRCYTGESYVGTIDAGCAPCLW